jgi:hypothetical protein
MERGDDEVIRQSKMGIDKESRTGGILFDRFESI